MCDNDKAALQPDKTFQGHNNGQHLDCTYVPGTVLNVGDVRSKEVAYSQVRM